ncbi:MAG: hypothetical protein ACOZCL_11070 [Bacillota bacterium]
MPEPGGRAEKIGNRYEGLWVAKQLLSLINEEIRSLIVEATGDEEYGVDLWVEYKDGHFEAQQCKSRNSHKEYWSVSDLMHKEILEKVKSQLEMNKSCHFRFVSAVSANMLRELCSRAKNNDGDPEKFYKYQLKGEAVKKNFSIFCNALNLSSENATERAIAYNYLRRIEVSQFQDDSLSKGDLVNKAGYLFTGNPEALIALLADYAVDNNRMGDKIYASEVIDYLYRQGFKFRELSKNDRIIPRFIELNDEYFSSFCLIGEEVLPRIETKECLKRILKGTSIIIHGEAGSGKSGCIYELAKELDNKKIPFLSIRLDRHMPSNNAEKYGEDLGLPASPVHCLAAISPDNLCVLLIDQLDALRWTNYHSSAAWPPCKEIINQVIRINSDRENPICLVFACRTYDLENDSLIASLFEASKKQDKDISWEKIPISLLDEKTVLSIIGSEYEEYSDKKKTLLRVPRNLSIWTKLNYDNRLSQFNTFSDLIQTWWRQLREEIVRLKIATDVEVVEVKNVLVEHLNMKEIAVIPLRIVDRCSQPAINALRSYGLLHEHDRLVEFSHQSYLDYFLAESMLDSYFEGRPLDYWIGNKEKQTPTRRYQIQLMLQMLLEESTSDYINCAQMVLSSNDVRFYYKHMVLTVLGQLENITKEVEKFVLEYIDSEFWFEHFYEAVLMGHNQYINILIKSGHIDKWLNSVSIKDKDLAFSLLRSVAKQIPDQVSHMLSKHISDNDELNYKLYSCLNGRLSDDSDIMFELRLNLIRKGIIQSFINLDELAGKNTLRALKLVHTILEINEEFSERINKVTFHCDEHGDFFNRLAKDKPIETWSLLMPCIEKYTKDITEIYDKKLENWSQARVYYRAGMSIEYISILLIKHTGAVLAENSPELFIKLYENYRRSTSLIINELLLHILRWLPRPDYVISWLLDNLAFRCFDETSEKDKLELAKAIIQTHSQNCSKDLFVQLEKELYYFKEPEQLYYAHNRYDYNMAQFKKNKGEERHFVFWHYWGEVQYFLLSAMDRKRLTKKSIELIGILNRKFSNYKPEQFLHCKHKSFGGTVISTIDNNWDKISDSQWLQIVKNNDVPLHANTMRIYKKNMVLESSIEQFARTLSNAARANPVRFAKLILQFESDVSEKYVDSILGAVSLNKPEVESNRNEDWIPVPFDMAQQIIRRYLNSKDEVIISAICRILEKRSVEQWDYDILQKISDIASEACQSIDKDISSEIENEDSFNRLYSNFYNSLQGKLAIAIANLLWDDRDRYSIFSNVIELFANSTYDEVRMASVRCIVPSYNIDKENATKWFLKVCSSDERISACREAYELYYLLYDEFKDDIEKIIKRMYKCSINEVCQVGCRHIANMYILYGAFESELDECIRGSITQKRAIIDIAINLSGYKQNKERCKRIITALKNDEDREITRQVGRLFYNDLLDEEGDLEFLLELSTSKMILNNLYAFFEFISRIKTSILCYKDIIFHACINICNSSNDEIEKMGVFHGGIAPKLSQLIANLYDQSQDDNNLKNRCLDMWDLMFEKKIGTIRELSKLILE